MEVNITDRSRELFKDLAEDADNWGGMPLWGGNVGGSREERGNLTQLKQAGLVQTDEDEGNVWVIFTDTGKAYAAELGVAID